MKKVFGVAVVLVLCLCLGCASAENVKGNIALLRMDDNGPISAVSLVAVGDILYIGTSYGIYTWTPGQDDAIMLDESMPIRGGSGGSLTYFSPEDIEREKKQYDRLIGDGDHLYGLNATFGTITPFDITDEGLVAGEVIQLDWQAFTYEEGEEDSVRTIFYGFIQDWALYLLAQDTAYDLNNNALHRYDLASGAGTILATDVIQDIFAYKDGKLLAMLYDMENPYKDGKEIMPTLVAVDGITGAMETVMKYPSSEATCLAYNKTTDTAYFLGLGEVYASVAGAPFKLVAYMPNKYMYTHAKAAILESGYYAAVIEGRMLIVRNVDPALALNQVLRISNLNRDAAYDAFTIAHPEIPVVYVSEYFYEPTAIAQFMITGRDDVDLFCVGVANGKFDRLRDKEYCYDLSQSDILMDAVEQMYPGLTKALWKNEKLYGVPQYVYGGALAYAPSVLEEIGLTVDDLPRTFIEMINFAVDWVELYGEENPKYKLFQYTSNIRKELLMQAVQEYITYYQLTGEKLTFDTPLFHKLLAKIEETAPVLSVLNVDAKGDGYAWAGDDVPTSLFWIDYYFMPNTNAPWGYEVCLLPLDEGMEPILVAQEHVYFINPNSPNVDIAMTYLEFLMENMSATSRIALYANENEPVEKPYYQQTIEPYYQRVAELEKQLAQVKEDGVARKNLVAMLQWEKDMLETQQQYRWEFSKEQIEQYRSFQQYIVISNTLVDRYSPEVYNLLNRYLDDEINGAKLVKELDRVIEMVDMENR